MINVRGNVMEKLIKQRNIAIGVASVLALCCIVLVCLLCIPRGIAAPVSAMPPAPFVASTESGKYHLIGCSYAEGILNENRVYYGTAADAEADGKEPCYFCRPDKEDAE